MRPIIVAIKELQLLAGDRSGLLVLFVMPAILVVVITLVQENVMRLTGQDQTVVLYLDLDQGAGRRLAGRTVERRRADHCHCAAGQSDERCRAGKRSPAAITGSVSSFPPAPPIFSSRSRHDCFAA